MAVSDIYHKHMTQRVASDPHWTVNCTAYCGAMAVNDSVLGGLLGINGRAFRALSDEPNPDPSSPGLNLQQIQQVCRKLRVPFYNMTGNGWDDLRNAVGQGTVASSRAILQLWYGAIPPEYRAQDSADFGHAVLAVAFDFAGRRVRASDPLAKVTRWYPESVLRDAAAEFSRRTGHADSFVWYGITRRVPLKK